MYMFLVKSTNLFVAITLFTACSSCFENKKDVQHSTEIIGANAPVISATERQLLTKLELIPLLDSMFEKLAVPPSDSVRIKKLIETVKSDSGLVHVPGYASFFVDSKECIGRAILRVKQSEIFVGITTMETKYKAELLFGFHLNHNLEYQAKPSPSLDLFLHCDAFATYNPDSLRMNEFEIIGVDRLKRVIIAKFNFHYNYLAMAHDLTYNAPKYELPVAPPNRIDIIDGYLILFETASTIQYGHWCK